MKDIKTTDASILAAQACVKAVIAAQKASGKALEAIVEGVFSSNDGVKDVREFSTQTIREYLKTDARINYGSLKAYFSWIDRAIVAGKLERGMTASALKEAAAEAPKKREGKQAASKGETEEKAKANVNSKAPAATIRFESGLLSELVKLAANLPGAMISKEALINWAIAEQAVPRVHRIKKAA